MWLITLPLKLLSLLSLVGFGYIAFNNSSDSSEDHQPDRISGISRLGTVTTMEKQLTESNGRIVYPGTTAAAENEKPELPGSWYLKYIELLSKNGFNPSLASEQDRAEMKRLIAKGSTNPLGDSKIMNSMANRLLQDYKNTVNITKSADR